MSAFRFFLVLLLLAIVSSGYAATFKDPQGRFAFEVPSGWKAVSSGDGGATVTDGASAYARIVPVPGGGKDMGLVKRVSDQIGAQWQEFKQGQHGDITFGGRHGIYVFFSGINPKGVQAIMRIVTAPVGDDATMLILSCPAADLNTSKVPLLAIENSFKFTTTGKETSDKPSAEALPAHAAPDGLQSQEGPNGERILTCGLHDVTSGAAAFKTGLHQTIGYFDASPNLLSVVRSKDDTITMATFSAVLHKAPVIAMAVSTYDPNGHSRFSLLLDKPDRFAQSLPSMLKRLYTITTETLDQSRPTGGDASMDFATFEKASQHITVNRTSFPDGTATVGLAPGFHTQVMEVAHFAARNEEGAYINMFAPLPMLDPNGSLYRSIAGIARNGGTSAAAFPGQVIVAYDSDPIGAWIKYLAGNARLKHFPDPNPQIKTSDPIADMMHGWTGKRATGTMTVNGKSFVFTGMFLVGPESRDGGWMVQVTLLAAPVDRAAKDMPGLIAMQRSIQVDMNAVGNVTMRNIARINAQTTQWLARNKADYDQASQERFERSQAIAAANRDTLDRSSAGFIQYISDKAVLQYNPTRAGGTFDAGLANALQQADPQNFTILQPSQYVKGRDY